MYNDRSMSDAILIKSKAIPSNPRSKNYPVGAKVMRSGSGGNATIITGGGASIDVLKIGDMRSLTDRNVFSSLRALAEILSIIIPKGDTTIELSDKNVLSALRANEQLNTAIEALKDLYLSKVHDDTALGHYVFSNGIYVTKDVDDNVPVLQEGDANCIQEGDVNAIQEYTEPGDVAVESTLGGLSNVNPIVDDLAIEDVVLTKKAGSSEWTQVVVPSGGGGSTVDDKYASSIADKNMVTVPSFTDIEGKKLSELEGKSFSDIFDMLFFATVYPTFIAPSVTISTTWGSNNKTVLVGDAAPQKDTFSYTFNRGAININVNGNITKQADRAGVETTAVYTADGSSTFPTALTWGTHTYKVVVNYAQGAQPKDSKGNNYGSPLPSGSVSANFVVNAGYNWYAGNDNPSQLLTPKGIVITSTTTLEHNFASEATGRYYWRIPKKKTPVKIEYYDTNSSKWVDDIYGKNWIKTSITVASVDYWDIKNVNPTQRGALRLRITLTNA